MVGGTDIVAPPRHERAKWGFFSLFFRPRISGNVCLVLRFCSSWRDIHLQSCEVYVQRVCVAADSVRTKEREPCAATQSNERKDVVTPTYMKALLEMSQERCLFGAGTCNEKETTRSWLHSPFGIMFPEEFFCRDSGSKGCSNQGGESHLQLFSQEGFVAISIFSLGRETSSQQR